jgi:type VI secretion system FHA domain protein
VITGGVYRIGRGSDNDWVLTDPLRLLSKSHCRIAFRSGRWQIDDTSTNGTFLNHETTPIGDQPRPLRGGDRVRLGAYEIEVEIAESTADPLPRWHDDDDIRPSANTSPAVTPSMLNPFATESGGSGVQPGSGYRHAEVPADFMSFDTPSERAFGGRVQPDHSPATENAFRPPTAVIPIPQDWALDVFAASPVVPAPPVAPAPLVPVAPAPSQPAPTQVAMPPAALEGDLMAAFLRGAGAEDARPNDPVRTLEALGQVLRATVVGLRQALIARHSIKGEFRIEHTMVRASGNNPLKFSAGDDDALAALLGVGRRNAMPPAAAVTEALRDIRLHELATVAAMQEAVRALLARFDPASLERQAAQGGLGKILGQGKIRAWDAFAALHAEVSQALSDDFDSVFGKAFARAYEQALLELTDREDRL